MASGTILTVSPSGETLFTVTLTARQNRDMIHEQLRKKNIASPRSPVEVRPPGTGCAFGLAGVPFDRTGGVLNVFP